MYNNENNDLFVNINKEELIDYLKNIYLYFRYSLNINSNNTFGFELEYEEKYIKPDIPNRTYTGFPTFLLCQELQNKGINYLFSDDQTVSCGGEIITKVLKDNDESWNLLKEICETINKYAYEGESCGGHFHIGMQAFKDLNSVKKFIKLWTKYENILYRFYYGEFRNNRLAIRRFALPIRNLYKVDLYTSLEDIKNVTLDRYYGVNFKNARNLEFGDKNTLEIRCPNASLKPIILQNNINVIFKMIEKCNDNNFDIDDINTDKYDSRIVYEYEKIDYDKAIEFCDLVFNNNLDKLFFLRQYFKDFVVRDNKSTLLSYSKRFYQ